MAETVQNNLGYYFDDDVSYMLWRRAWFSDQTIHWICPVLLFSYFKSATLELIRERNAIAWNHCTNKNKNLENGVGKENPCQEKRKKKEKSLLSWSSFLILMVLLMATLLRVWVFLLLLIWVFKLICTYKSKNNFYKMIIKKNIKIRMIKIGIKINIKIIKWWN